MRTRIPILRLAVGLFILILVWPCSGCRQSTQGLFTRPELRSYERLGVIGLEEEQEQIFMAIYLRSFPELNITFVERGRLADVMGEQDLLQGRLNNRTRAKISQILGVELLLMCKHEAAGAAGRKKKLRVRIVDSQTGVIVGSIITQAANDFEHLCHMAARGLKADLAGKKNGGRKYYGGSSTPRKREIPMPM